MKRNVLRSLIKILALVLIPFMALAEANGVRANGKPVSFDVQPAVVLLWQSGVGFPSGAQGSNCDGPAGAEWEVNAQGR